MEFLQRGRSVLSSNVTNTLLCELCIGRMGKVNFTDRTTAMTFISQCRYCPVRFPGAIFWLIWFRVHPGHGLLAHRHGNVILHALCEPKG
jgi:hypothetical protein